MTFERTGVNPNFGAAPDRLPESRFSEVWLCPNSNCCCFLCLIQRLLSRLSDCAVGCGFCQICFLTFYDWVVRPLVTKFCQFWTAELPRKRQVSLWALQTCWSSQSSMLPWFHWRYRMHSPSRLHSQLACRGVSSVFWIQVWFHLIFQARGVASSHWTLYTAFLSTLRCFLVAHISS